MEKYDVITAVAEAFDRAEKAETQLHYYAAFGIVEADEEEPSLFDRIAVKVGKKKIVKDSLGYWNEVRVSRDDETEVVTVEPYDKWAKRVVDAEKIPDQFSKKDFFEYFEWELKSKYEEEKQKAIEKFNREEEGE